MPQSSKTVEPRGIGAGSVCLTFLAYLIKVVGATLWQFSFDRTRRMSTTNTGPENNSQEKAHRQSGPLEWLLATSILFLALQMYGDPAKLAAWIFGILDVRTWTYDTSIAMSGRLS